MLSKIRIFDLLEALFTHFAQILEKIISSWWTAVAVTSR